MLGEPMEPRGSTRSFRYLKFADTDLMVIPCVVLVVAADVILLLFR